MPVHSVLYLVGSALLRIILWATFGREAKVPLLMLLPVLAAGLVGDCAILVYLTLPARLLGTTLPSRWRPTGHWPKAAYAFGFAVIFAMLVLAQCEYFFFEEFDSRFNLVAVDYFRYPHEVFINLWDSYPVASMLLVNALISAALAFGVRTMSTARPIAPPRREWRPLVAHVALAVVVTLSISTDTFSFSGNRVINELTANGVSSIFRALRTNELDYDALYRTGDPNALFDLLVADLGPGRGTWTDLAGGSLNRLVPARPSEGLGKLNVVVVVEESFGARYVGAYGDGRGLTPEFDALAEQGILFTNAFATGTRTVRGLEALVASFPPIPSESILRRPGSDQVATWGHVMAANGYHTSFLYGGFGLFDDMNPFFAASGFEISDRAHIEDPQFSNIWGVSDEDLFRHAVDYFDGVAAEGEPFFSVIVSTSNHKPYTFPQGVPGVPVSGGGRDAGIRYADYALGGFIRSASKKPWFANTVFVVVADHDARVYGKQQVPLYSYRIPLLVLAPGRLEARRVDLPTSQIDVAPTVLGLLGLGYEAPFFGRDVLAPGARPRPMLINHDHNVAIYRDDTLAVLGLNRVAASYRASKDGTKLEETAPDGPLIELATAYYQTAFKLFQSRKYQASTQAVVTQAPTTDSPLSPSSIAGVGNFARVTDGIWRGARPSREGFAELRKMGVRTIVNLQRTSDRGPLRGTGLDYIHISSTASGIDEEDQEPSP